MKRNSLFFGLILILIGACKPGLPDDVAEAYAAIGEVDFNLDITPLLSDRCYHCHGAAGEQRKAGLRLDSREGLFSANKNGDHAFAGGKPGKSEAILRILSDDPEIQMPPPESNRFLSAREKALLIKWVEDGAEWKEHWAFIPPERPSVPPDRSAPHPRGTG